MCNTCAVSSVAVATQSSDAKLYFFAFSRNEVRNLVPNSYSRKGPVGLVIRIRIHLYSNTLLFLLTLVVIYSRNHPSTIDVINLDTPFLALPVYQNWLTKNSKAFNFNT